MLFNSYIFVFLLLPISLLGYYLLNWKKQYRMGLSFLFVISCWFIGYLNVQYLFVLLPSVLINYGIAFYMQRKAKQVERKAVLAAGVTFNLTLLVVFKYCNFLLDNVNQVFQMNIKLLEILLPLGISFYTFQQITYLVDCYRDQKIQYGFLEYAVYITFFPQFIQGPIVLQSEMIPQFLDEKKKKFDYTSFAEGMYIFSMGMGKKVLIADSLAKIVNGGYGSVDSLNSISAILLILAYTLQIYFDFCGYSDMAVGIGRMFQIELPWNFDSPYKAASIDEFWDRWHTTLTRFFTKYVYIPLGGSRKGTVRTYINIFLIFLFSGIWHGAAWTFVLWGIMHGAAKMIKRLMNQCKIQLPKVLEGILTFVFVNIAWVFFRAETIDQAFVLLQRAVTGGFGAIDKALYDSFDNMMEVSILIRADVLDITSKVPGIFAGLLILAALAACILMRNTKQKAEQRRPAIKQVSRTMFAHTGK